MSHSNSRGPAKQRRLRKTWLLNTFGDGERVECSIKGPKCLGILTFSNITVDRYPVPGALGGTYRRGNIRPACLPCNSGEGAKFGYMMKRLVSQ